MYSISKLVQMVIVIFVKIMAKARHGEKKYHESLKRN